MNKQTLIAKLLEYRALHQQIAPYMTILAERQMHSGHLNWDSCEFIGMEGDELLIRTYGEKAASGDGHYDVEQLCQFFNEPRTEEFIKDRAERVERIRLDNERREKRKASGT